MKEAVLGLGKSDITIQLVFACLRFAKRFANFLVNLLPFVEITMLGESTF